MLPKTNYVRLQSLNRNNGASNILLCEYFRKKKNIVYLISYKLCLAWNQMLYICGSVHHA